MAKSQYSKLDYFLPMALVKEENSLRDIKGGKVATNNGATKVFEGFDFNGIDNYITGFNPFIDGINYQLNDALIGVFIADVGNINDGSGHTPVGGGDANSRADFFVNIIGLAKQSFRVNALQSDSSVYEIPLVNNQLSLSTRTTSTQSDLYNDGVSVASSSVPSNTVPNANIDIGRLNNDGVGINYTQETVSLFTAGAAIGVNQVAKNDIYRQWLLDLKINLSPDENILAGATITDSLQGVTVTDELKGN